MRLRQVEPLSSYASRRPRLVALMRVGIGIWLLVAGAILYGSGYWWGVLMAAPAALHFYLAYRLRHSVGVSAGTALCRLGQACGVAAAENAHAGAAAVSPIQRSLRTQGA